MLPERRRLDDDVATLPGLDGRKMSKSYGNVIPLFAAAKAMRKQVMKIKTELARAGRAEGHRGLARSSRSTARSRRQTRRAAVRERYAAGIGWGEMKQLLFERIDAELAPARAEYERLIASPQEVERHLLAGAEKARAVCKPFIAEIRDRVGIRRLTR